MSLSADALNFVLALDDRLTPALGKAGRSYARFTRDLDKQNSRAVKSVNKAFSAMSDLARSFEALPKKAIESYRQAAQAVQRVAKPIKMRVVLDVAGKKFEQGLARAVTAAVRRALSTATMNVQMGPAGRPVGRSARGGATVSSPSGSTSIPVAAMASASAPATRRAARDLFVPNNPRDALGANGRLAKRGYQDAYSAAGKAVGGKGAAASLQALQLAFLAMPAYERKKAMSDYLTMTRALRNGNAIVPPVPPGRGRGRGGGGGGIQSIAQDTRFLAIMSVIDHVKPLLNNATQFNQGMNTINKGVHLSRNDLGSLRDMGTDIAKQTGGVLNTTDAQGAMLALKQVGVTTRDEWAKLVPVVALATKAMTITVDEAAGAARMLSKQMGLSKDSIEDVMAEMGKIEEQTGFSGSAQAAAMQTNTQAAMPYLGTQSAKGRQSALTNLSKLEGALLQGGVAPDDARSFVGQVASALGGNQDAIKAVQQATGLTGGRGGTLELAAQRGDWTSAIQQMSLSANRAGDAQQVTATAGAWGISPSGVSAVGAHSADILASLSAENAGQVGAGTGKATLQNFAKTSMAAGEQTENKVKDMIMSWIPDIVKNSWAEMAGGASSVVIAAQVARWAAGALGLGGATKAATVAEDLAGGLGGAATSKGGWMKWAATGALSLAKRALIPLTAATIGATVADAIDQAPGKDLAGSAADAMAPVVNPVMKVLNSIDTGLYSAGHTAPDSNTVGLVTQGDITTAVNARASATARTGQANDAMIQSLMQSFMDALRTGAPTPVIGAAPSGPAMIGPRENISDAYLRQVAGGGG